MKTKMKRCDGCGKSRMIYKAHGRQKFCRTCWGKHVDGAPLAKPGRKASIMKTSSQKEKKDRLYSIIRGQFLHSHMMCQARLPGCTLKSTDIHHKRGRTGEYMLDTTYFLAVCRSCHDLIELNVEMAKEEGFSESRLQTNEKDEG